MKVFKRSFLESVFSSISPSARRKAGSCKRKSSTFSSEYQALEPRQLLAADINLGVTPQSGVLLEQFNGIGGNNLSALTSHATYPNSPNIVATTGDFASARNVGDNYGLRMRGYITAPADGEYKFWIASDNQGSLLLSDSEDPSGATEIASVAGWTWRYQFYKYASQESVAITLAEGETYYIEGLMKEGGGGDSLTVAWSGPGISDGTPVVIDQSYLTVFDEVNHAPQLVDDAFALLEDADEVTIAPLVNDVPVHGSSLTVLGYSAAENGSLTLNDDGTFSYTPEQDFFGTDSFTYTVRNEIGATATATVDLNVEQTSGLLLERYHGIGGNALSNLTNSDKFPLAPDVVGQVDNFEIPKNNGANYGARLRGYLTVPETGEYTFWIAADDSGQLWLSDDSSARNAVKIAETTRWTGFRQWNKYASQKSVSVLLVAGESYYVEALMKEGGGGDNLSVAWSGPGVSDNSPVVISGEFLTAYDSSRDLLPASSLDVEFLSHSEALVSWEIPEGASAVGYDVQASNDGGASFETVATTDAGATLAVAVGLNEEADYLFRVVASDSELDANSLVSEIVSSSSPSMLVGPDSESGAYKISLENNGNWTRAEAGYAASGSFEAKSDYLVADSIESAIRQSVTGSVLVTDFDDNQNEFVFGSNEAFRVIRFGDLSESDQQAARDKFSQFFGLIPFSVSDDQWMIVLEDSYGWKSNGDSDYNDGFILVDFENGVSIDLVDDTGVDDSDNITFGTAVDDYENNSLTFAGTAPRNTELVLTLGDGNEIDLTSDNSGRWSYTHEQVPDGSWEYTISLASDVTFVSTAAEPPAGGNSATIVVAKDQKAPVVNGEFRLTNRKVDGVVVPTVSVYISALDIEAADKGFPAFSKKVNFNFVTVEFTKGEGGNEETFAQQLKIPKTTFWQTEASNSLHRSFDIDVSEINFPANFKATDLTKIQINPGTKPLQDLAGNVYKGPTDLLKINEQDQHTEWHHIVPQAGGLRELLTQKLTDADKENVATLLNSAANGWMLYVDAHKALTHFGGLAGEQQVSYNTHFETYLRSLDDGSTRFSTILETMKNRMQTYLANAGGDVKAKGLQATTNYNDARARDVIMDDTEKNASIELWKSPQLN